MESSTASDTRVRRWELESLIRQQERLERRIEALERSINRLGSDLIMVALAVGTTNEQTG